MADKALVMSLAKLVIAAAWADGTLIEEEKNALKDLLFTLPQVPGEEWQQLEIYMDSAVGADERDRLLHDVLGRAQTDEDRALVVDALRALAECDGEVTETEAALLAQVESALERKDTGLFSQFAGMVKGLVGRRSTVYHMGPNREGRLDDFIRNTVYYQLVSEMESGGAVIDVPEAQARKLCLAAGLMARIAWVDSEISEEEKGAIRRVLADTWGLSDPEAALICKVSVSRVMKGLDYFRLGRGFFECTTPDERRAFVKSLFQIANAAGKTSYDEVEEIRTIAHSLRLTHKEFIDAKLTVPRDDLL